MGKRMKLLVKQYSFTLMVHHNETLQGAFLWWITRKNKHCRKFCPMCSYYFRCQEDVALENLLEVK